MKWWDFSDLTFVIFFSILAVCLFLLLVLLVTLCLNILFQRKFFNGIKKTTNTTRIFIIDTRNNVVTYFDGNKIRNKRKENLGAFYAGFYPEDQEKVKAWIYDICVRQIQVDEYLQSDVVVNHGRNNFFSLLKLIKFNRETGILHIENFILPYITPNNTFKKAKELFGLLSKEQMKEIITTTKSDDGFTYGIRFFNTQSHFSATENVEQLMILIPKNAVYSFVKDKHHPRQLLENAINEVILFDLKLGTKEEALVLAGSLEKEIKKQISINGLDNYVSFSIGIVQNSQYYQDYDSIVATAQQACIFAQQNNFKYYLFERNSSSPIVETGQYAKEVYKLLQPNTLRFLFRPIIDCNSGKVVGYFDYVKSYTTPYNGYMEMSKYASRAEKNKELFSLVAKNVINRFSNERLDPFSILFLSLSLVDAPYILDVIHQIPNAKNIDLVLLFEEREINNNSSQLSVIDSYILGIKNEGIKVALLLDDKNLILTNDVYYKFDYFIIKALPQTEMRHDEKINLSIRSLAEQLLKFKKPIVATDLNSVADVEFTIKSGITLLSSDSIAHASEMILPVEKRKLDKIKAISGK